jgi:hypothetical protein
MITLRATFTLPETVYVSGDVLLMTKNDDTSAQVEPRAHIDRKIKKKNNDDDASRILSRRAKTPLRKRRKKFHTPR